jgi:hypothetical protein
VAALIDIRAADEGPVAGPGMIRNQNHARICRTWFRPVKLSFDIADSPSEDELHLIAGIGQLDFAAANFLAVHENLFHIGGFIGVHVK